MRHISKRKQLQHLIREMVIEETSLLNEKKIIHGQGKPYGQVVFYAGGAGSGKGFSIEQFADFERFKIINVDDWKQMFIKSHRLKGKYPEIADWLNDKGKLKSPSAVSKMHQFVKQFGLKQKQLKAMFSDANPDRLPNLLFDQTMKSIGKVNNLYVPHLLDAGYKPENIHITWVLTDVEVAKVNNAGRNRSVPDEILVKTHDGAAKTLWNIINKGFPRGIDGEFRVIFGDREYTVFEDRFNDEYRDYDDIDPRIAGPIDRRDDPEKEEIKKTVVRDFNYAKFKNAGEPVVNQKEFKRRVGEVFVEDAPHVFKYIDDPDIVDWFFD